MMQIILCDIRHCDITGQSFLRYDVMTCAHTCIAFALGRILISTIISTFWVYHFVIHMLSSLLLNRPKSSQAWWSVLWVNMNTLRAYRHTHVMTPRDYVLLWQKENAMVLCCTVRIKGCMTVLLKSSLSIGFIMRNY